VRGRTLDPGYPKRNAGGLKYVVMLVLKSIKMVAILGAVTLRDLIAQNVLVKKSF